MEVIERHPQAISQQADRDKSHPFIQRREGLDIQRPIELHDDDVVDQEDAVGIFGYQFHRDFHQAEVQELCQESQHYEEGDADEGYRQVLGDLGQ